MEALVTCQVQNIAMMINKGNIQNHLFLFSNQNPTVSRHSLKSALRGFELKMNENMSLSLSLWAPDKERFFLFLQCLFLSLNPTFDHLLEVSHEDDSNKWSNIGFGEEITQVMSIEVFY